MQKRDMLDKIDSYLCENFSAVRGKPVNSSKLTGLPLFLRGGYDFYESTFQKIRIVFAEVKHTSATPALLEKQLVLLESHFKSVVVFAFESLLAFERKRFIEKRIPFVEPFKQLYIPSLLLELNNIAKKKILLSSMELGKMSFPTQFTLLYHLQKESLNKYSLQQLSKKLNYSRMTISRVLRELVLLGIVENSEGKEKQLIFTKDKHELWKQIQDKLISPVKEVCYIDEKLNTKQLAKSFDSALAVYSNLSEGTQKNYAIGKEEFLRLKIKEKKNKKFGQFRLEVWHYDPLLLSSNHVVDPISLFLSMKNEEDPRVIGALKEMMGKIKWLKE